MRLRDLQQKDAAPMLQWMHDPFVVEKLQTDFAKKTMEDCMNFIANSRDEKNVHLAIVNEDDAYLGTVSLKHITGDAAEFAITIGRAAMGTGCAIWAMHEILQMGFEQYSLQRIYWCVAKDNKRALRFYDKNVFPRVEAESLGKIEGYTPEQISAYVWYQVVTGKKESI